ncbi:MAG: zinc ribbon domain-containing protein [Anaerolineae bacterium]
MSDLLVSLGLSSDIALALTIYLIVIVAAFWLAMIIWTYRDMRSRSRDRLSQLGVGLLVALLTFPGLLIYLFLRPRETLGEAYERSLEEEALLQEIEDKPTCPGCAQNIREGWQVCPHCFTRLKKTCVNCRQPLELSWQICPHCTVPQPAITEQNVPAVPYSRSTGYGQDAGENEVSRRRRTAMAATRTSESLEFVDTE